MNAGPGTIVEEIDELYQSESKDRHPEISGEPKKIVEIHPSASLALRGAPVESIKEMKKSGGARQILLKWLVSQGLKGIDINGSVSDHYVAACAAALAAWKWYLGQSVWIFNSEMPFHPHDFAC